MNVIDAATHALATQSALAPALAFIAGATTALGPCAASRMIAAIGLTGAVRSKSQRIMVLGALVGGLCCGYVAIGCASYGVSTLMRNSALLYAIGALVLGVIGVRTIIVAKAHTCSPHHPDTPASFGGAFLLGGSMALLVSPCCTPIVAALVGFGIASGQLWLDAVTLASFAIGHAVPMIVAGLGAGRAGDALGRFSVPLATVSGSLLIALGAYYAVLA